jgi:hypothetical protein
MRKFDDINIIGGEVAVSNSFKTTKASKKQKTAQDRLNLLIDTSFFENETFYQLIKVDFVDISSANTMDGLHKYHVLKTNTRYLIQWTKLHDDEILNSTTNQFNAEPYALIMIPCAEFIEILLKCKHENDLDHVADFVNNLLKKLGMDFCQENNLNLIFAFLDFDREALKIQKKVNILSYFLMISYDFKHFSF